MHKRLTEFWIKLLVYTSPFIALLIVYITVDPFKVLWHYDSYYPTKGLWVYGLDRDYISTQTFLNHYKSNNYNAFFLGNSRSLSYRVAEWQKHIGQQRCYHFDASGEGVYGIDRKVQLLDKSGCKIDYALIVMDHETLENITNPKGHLGVKHPILSGQSYYDFQMEFLKAFLYPEFLRAFFDYLVTSTFKPYMDAVLYNDPVEYSLPANELTFYYNDSIIAHNPEAYYQKYKKLFAGPSMENDTNPPVIRDTQKLMLQDIKNIFVKHHTQYRIIINPAYDKLKFNPDDLACLRNIFGADKVYDFSGKNEITSDYHNYYDASHYRPNIATMLMDTVYAK